MKITLKVFGTIFAIVALLACAASTFRNLRDAKDMAEMESTLGTTQAQFDEMSDSMAAMGADHSELDEVNSAISDLPSKGQFTAAGVATGILTVLSIVLIVFQFVNKLKPATIVFVLTLIVGIAAIVLSPSLPETFSGAASNRTIAMFGAIPAILAGLTAFAVARMSRPASAM